MSVMGMANRGVKVVSKFSVITRKKAGFTATQSRTVEQGKKCNLVLVTQECDGWMVGRTDRHDDYQHRPDTGE